MQILNLYVQSGQVRVVNRDLVVAILNKEIIAVRRAAVVLLPLQRANQLGCRKIIDVITGNQVVRAAAQEAAGVVVNLAVGFLQDDGGSPSFVKEFKCSVVIVNNHASVLAQQSVIVQAFLVDCLKEAISGMARKPYSQGINCSPAVLYRP